MNKIKTTVENDKYIFNLNGYDIHFCNLNDENSRAHLWNIRGIFKDGVTVCPQGTDIIGVLREKDQADFMGGVHGDETFVELRILADGKEFSQDFIESDRIDILMYSHLTRVSTGENVIDRMVHIELKENTITISTSFKCLVDGFNLDISYGCGMFAWFNDMSEYAYSNFGPITAPEVNFAKSVNVNRMITNSVCKLPHAFVKIENLVGYESEKYTGTVFYYGNEAHPRIKIYFSNDRNSVWDKDHVCHGKARYTLI